MLSAFSPRSVPSCRLEHYIFSVCFANFEKVNYFGRGEIVECLTRFYQVQYLPIKLVDTCQEILESKYDFF